MSLFEDDDVEEGGELPINKDYAARYEKWRRGEEIEKLKNRLGDDPTLSSSDSETSDDDFVEPDNPEFDHDFLVTLGALHKKELIPKKDNYFPGDYRKKKTENKKDEAMTIKDYHRHLILDYNGIPDEDDNGSCPSSKVLLEKKPATKFEDGMKSDDEDNDDDGLLASGLFKVKTDEKDKPRKLDDDAVAFVKGDITSLKNASDKNWLEGLKEAWNSPNLPKADKWLADFFLNKRYLENEDESTEREYNNVIIDEETLSEDENTLETMETFETKYRFRYEEPDQEFIKKYPRSIQESMRPKNEKRKLKHQALKERKLQEKELKKQEIEKLKALKYQEIRAKIERIKEASGNDDIDFGDTNLDDEFDPEAHDEAMSHMFGDDYYTHDEGTEEKPVFEYSDDDDYVINDYDDWFKEELHNTTDQVGSKDTQQDENGEGGYFEDFNMDADYDESSHSQQQLQKIMKYDSQNKRRRRKSKFAKVLGTQKPVFDPQEKNFDSYFDEYYQLDCEDIIGGMPCRFNYRQVHPNNFGLSTEEILSAENKELNKWYSLKKLLKYDRTDDQEKLDNNMCNNRASSLKVKQRIFPSLFSRDPEEELLADQEKTRIKNLKKKLRRQKKQDKGEDLKSNNPLIKHRELHEVLNNADNKIKEKKAKKVDPGKSVENPTGNRKDIFDSCIKKRKNDQVDMDDDDDVQIHAEGLESKEYQDAGTEIKKKLVDDTSGMEECGKTKDAVDMPMKVNKNIVKTSHKVSTHAREMKTGVKKSRKITSKKMKRTQAMEKTQTQVLPGLSDARLAAYGQNPKQLKKKARYGKSNLEEKISATFRDSR
ncbi:hypothetical protein Pmani_020820 [Petrolisthes manimaculis]|uniref:Protein KRI1 homolog n=1 Tax=Petrolisthes manimaculis TaxID=1843537 RepID=A0AAE1U3X1_9EUCA|nr:hypothetical protein Pmani_020820 [Petrolisthes manimaculis]